MTGSEPVKKVRRNEAEERLLIEAVQRDTARFAELYEIYFELVYAYVARRTQSRDQAEELTSEVFHRALAHLPRFRWTGAPFAAWLFRIASNLIADRAKRAARERNVSLDQSPSIRGSSLWEDSLDVRRGSSSQQIDLEDSERRAELFRLVDRLAEDQRRVVVMRFAEEKSIRQIADELDRSEGAVKQLQFRALENLRAKLARQ